MKTNTSSSEPQRPGFVFSRPYWLALSASVVLFVAGVAVVEKNGGGGLKLAGAIALSFLPLASAGIVSFVRYRNQIRSSK
jgi:hypothetical protein